MKGRQKPHAELARRRNTGVGTRKFSTERRLLRLKIPILADDNRAKQESDYDVESMRWLHN